MPDTETPDGDALEQQQDLTDPESAVGGGRTEVGFEAPEADAVEQQTPVGSTESDDTPSSRWDVDEGDLAESSREVGFDDDDYR